VVFTNTAEEFRNPITEEHIVTFFGVIGTSKKNSSLRFRFTYKPKNIHNFGKINKKKSYKISFKNITALLLQTSSSSEQCFLFFIQVLYFEFKLCCVHAI
jgi:hypothetical protein